MTPVPINMLAVLACVVVSMILGSAWFGPLFGKAWMKLAGMNKPASMTKEMKDAMMKSYAIMAVGSFLTAYVTAHSLVFASTFTHTYGTSAGLMVGFWNWLGFVAPVQVGDQLWGNKPWKLFLITGGYWLVNLCLTGVILANWK